MTQPGNMTTREYQLGDDEFARIRQLVMRHSGINLQPAKRDLVYGRLAKRLRNLGFNTFRAYCDHVEDSPQELEEFTNAITTNLTSFFREPHHFEYLAQTLVPELLERQRANRRIRIWSAGCSTGEEPYSIAITLREAIPDIQNWDVRILATDLDTNCVAHARNGIYEAEKLASIDQRLLRKWFQRGTGARSSKVRLTASVRDMISFKQLNLMRDWPVKGPFEAIFCRNVIIYFDKDTQRRLFARYAQVLPSGARLFLGHSESLHNVSDQFELIGKTIYRRVAL
ncbi:MAG: protein-glutamate O-methyltransferase CheR [Dehalococcoidia bacterium]